MRIWVDADACPRVIKEILYRAADRLAIPLVLVANRPIHTPRSLNIRSVRVGTGFDVADRYIVEQVTPGDLVVTADVPLAADVVEAGGTALDPRGQLYTAENVQERLAVRNLMDELRGSGVELGGPASIQASDRRAFADQLDRFLARRSG